MRKLIFFLIIFLIPTFLLAYSESYVVMDADSGRILGSKNMNEKYLVASTTKIMTTILALENGSLKDKYVASDVITSVYGSMIYTKEGEEFTLEDLLYGLMLRSGNDASVIIAENQGGHDKFVEKMNKLAKKIGMKNTTFENPHGLDDDTKNYSTAYDLALLMKYAMQNEDFRKITNTKKYRVTTNMTTHLWYNKNKLLTTYKYATGGKIGYTEKSRHVFVSSATKNKKNLIVATIRDTDRFNTHENLYEEYFNKYEKYKILDKYTFSLIDDNYKNYHLYIKNDFYMLLKENEKDNLRLDIIINKKINKNKVGSVNVMLKDDLIHTETIYGVEKNNKIKSIKKMLFFWK